MNVQVIEARNAARPARLRVVAYVRVSSEAEELENSMENQKAFFNDFIRGHEDWEFVKIYCDFGISGFSNRRPAFQRMMKDARAKKFDLILVKSISRFARNTETLLKATRELKTLGIGVFFCLQNTNTLTAAGELMLTVRAAFAQAESDSASENLKLAYRHMHEQGIPHPNVLKTYGYEPGENMHLQIKEPEASVVRKIYGLILDGVHRAQIARYLNQQGIPSPSGRQWCDRQINRMLHNVTYKGDLLLGKTYHDVNRVRRQNHGESDSWYVTGNHPAIIPPAQWEAVQRALELRHEEFYPQRAPLQATEPHNSHSTYSLSGLLHCPYCGGILLHKRSKTNAFWACKRTIKEGVSACKGIWVPADVADQWDVHEPTVVFKNCDEFGRPSFTTCPLEEYELRKEE